MFKKMLPVVVNHKQFQIVKSFEIYYTRKHYFNTRTTLGSHVLESLVFFSIKCFLNGSPAIKNLF